MTRRRAQRSNCAKRLVLGAANIGLAEAIWICTLQPPAILAQSAGPVTGKGAIVRVTPTWHFRGVSARSLILDAYHLLDCQLSGGPDWLDDSLDLKGYDNPPIGRFPSLDDSPRPQGIPMLQKILAERFNLLVHRTTRKMPVYVLTVGKSGPKFLPAKDGEAEPPMAPRDPGAPIFERHVMTMPDFADWLSRSVWMDRPVVDKTGLHGVYILDWQLHPGEDDFIATVEETFGLKLEAQTAPLEILVIDHIEKPGAP